MHFILVTESFEDTMNSDLLLIIVEEGELGCEVLGNDVKSQVA
jgi:hypothetical protein